MLAGVCGGLGRYFDVNPVFYRVGFVVLTLLGGAGILIYGAALLVIPNEGEDESIASDVLRNHRQRPCALVGLALVAVAGLSLLSHASLWPHGDAAWSSCSSRRVILWSRRAEAGKRPPGPAGGPDRARDARSRSSSSSARSSRRSHVHLSRGVGDRSYQPPSRPPSSTTTGSASARSSSTSRDLRFPPRRRTTAPRRHRQPARHRPARSHGALEATPTGAMRRARPQRRRPRTSTRRRPGRRGQAPARRSTRTSGPARSR